MQIQSFTPFLVRGLLVLTVVVANTRSGAAQGFDPGVRARGMSGAFVAVADDASAAWWNPAGLATIRFLDASIDVGSARMSTPRAIGRLMGWRPDDGGRAGSSSPCPCWGSASTG
jgi:hypothetical protein